MPRLVCKAIMWILFIVLIFVVSRTPSLASPPRTRSIACSVPSASHILLCVPLLLVLSLASFAHLASVVQSAEAIVQEKQGGSLSLGLPPVSANTPIIGALLRAILSCGSRPRHAEGSSRGTRCCSLHTTAISRQTGFADRCGGCCYSYE